jgi:multidrug resistance protein, MATE family
MTLANLSTPLLGFADATVIGRLGSAHLLGAIAAASIIFDFVFWGFGFLRMGTAGLAAQAKGQRDSKEEKALFARALIIAAGLGCLVITLQQPIATIGFGLIDATPEVTQAARLYYDARIWSAPFVFANYAVLGALTGRARTDIALILQVCINLGNIALNVWLVYGLSLGVRGSGIGTLTAEVIGTILGLSVAWRLYGNPFTLAPRFIFDRSKFSRMIGVNRDIMIRTAALMFAFAFFTSRGARGGDVTLAANAVLMNLFLVCAFFLDGFATAAAQICGEAVGAGDAASFRRAIHLTLTWGFTFAVLACILALTGGSVFIDVVSTNAQVRETARQVLLFAAATPLCGAAAFIFDGVFIGATWTQAMRNAMLAALACYIGAIILLQPLANAGLWSALLLFLVARGLFQAVLYPRLIAVTFPAAQSAAKRPVTSESRP